jgi:hypothetical protein
MHTVNNKRDIMTNNDSKIVKIQRVSNGVHITVPKSMAHILDNVHYVKCTIDKDGIRYSPVASK